MTDQKAYQEYIQRRYNASCKAVIRCAALDKILKLNEKFSGKGHAAHVCKSCASLPPEKQAEQMTINRLLNLPWRLSKEQISWLKNRMKDKRREVRALAKEQYEMRFPPKRLEDIEDNFDFLDEDDLIE